MRFLKLLWQCFTVWNNIPNTNLDGVEAILAHGAGMRKDGPGKVDEYNARLVRDLYHRLRVPVIAQGEVAICLKNFPPLTASPTQQQSDHYLTTRDIARWQKSVCDVNGIKRVVLVSYHPHFWRALRATEKVGLEVCIPRGLKEMHDSQNTLRWIRYKWINRLYELAARLHYLLKGWV